MRGVTRGFASAGREIDSRTLLRERVAELSVLAKDLTAALQTLQATDLPRVEEEFDFYDEVRRFETWLIKRTLKHTGGSQRKAAELLRMKYSTLNAKVKNLNIDPWSNESQA